MGNVKQDKRWLPFTILLSQAINSTISPEPMSVRSRQWLFQKAKIGFIRARRSSHNWFTADTNFCSHHGIDLLCSFLATKD